MAMIHINRNRENLGKFTDQEVADGLKSGRFLPADLAWREPMPTWQPLSTFSDLPDPSPEDRLSIPVEDASATPSEAIEPAWERESGLALKAAIESVKHVFSTPTSTFQNLPPTGGIGRPLFFYTLAGWLSGGFGIFYQLIASIINPEMILGEAAKGVSPGVLVAGFVSVLLFLPLFLLVGIFVSSALFHLLLMITGAANNGFEATFRALAYAGGATSMLQLIPLCGGYLYPLANLFYGVIALKEVHRTEMWRVVLAAVLMFFLCCGAALAMVAGMTALAASMGIKI